MRRYVGFDEESAALLRAFHPVAEPRLEVIVGDFYDVIQKHPDAYQAITGGDAQIERLKRTLIRWLDSVLIGPHDEEYLASHARIGRVHVRIALPQQFMFTAMNRIRSALTRLAVSELHDDTDRCLHTLTAIGQVLDLELALMLDTYREDLLGRMRAHERLATIGQVAGSIGHELRNPLGIIESSLYLLRTHLGPLAEEDPKVQKHLTRIGTQVTVCSTTITHLLELARSRMPSKAWHNLRGVVERAVEYASLEPSQVVLDIPPELEVLADAEQLRQVLVNLLQNAVQAHPRCTITVTGQQVPGGTQIWVRDDGPGIPSDLHSRVFDALFTTRAKGTGLGLSLCRRILEAHRGEITLQPEARGAHFRLWLPDHDSDGRRSLVPDDVELGGTS
ncbi:MAG: histidine kinase [Polyangiaceae bacterium]|nr:histidine kinase [Polyangiaceae bacterium]MCW5789383.1 histidine kinase [Polyangiaceae bacterium]